MPVKQFQINVLYNELEAFRESIAKSNHELFIQNYVNEHLNDGITTKEDFYSLFLSAAVVLNDLEIVKYIFQQEHNDNILTSADGTGFSPLSTILYSGNKDILNLVKEHLNNPNNKIIKTDISPDDFDNIVRMLFYPTIEYLDYITCLEEYLKPIFIPEAIEKLVEALGEDSD